MLSGVYCAKRLLAWWAIAFTLACLLTGCSSHSFAPVSSLHQPFHIVGKGETLYSIAFRYGLDFRTVAEINGLRPPYHIRPQQKLWLKTKTPTRPIKPKLSHKQHPVLKRAVKAKPQAKPTIKPAARTLPVATHFSWRWPTSGTVISRYAPSVAGNNGIDIAGAYGQLVYTAAPGTVVYCGSGLRGYGQLIIIKHSDELLSAYAHNSQVLVKEGMKIKPGQAIAKMGNSDSTRIKLHFEIRRAGKPVDPLLFLPRKKQ